MAKTTSPTKSRTKTATKRKVATKKTTSKRSAAKVLTSSGQKIVREKGRKKQWLRLRRYAATVAVLLVMVLGWVGYAQRVDQQVADWAHMQWINASTAAGFAFDELIVEGRVLTPPQDIIDAVGLEIGDSLFLVSLEQMRARLIALETVQDAQVGRDLGGRIMITLEERRPYALWQHQQRLYVVDEEGVVLSALAPSDYAYLVTVVGDNVREHMDELVSFLHANEEMAQQVSAAVYVSNRRWDIHFQSGIQIMLPEDNPAKAWEKLAQMQREHGILTQQVEAIDLRIEDRVFITLPEQQGRSKEPSSDV